MALALQHQTPAEFAARFWARVRRAWFASRGDSPEAVAARARFEWLIWWLIEEINSGGITDAGARTTFNAAYGRSLNAAQWTTFKTTRLVPIHDRHAASKSEPNL